MRRTFLILTQVYVPDPAAVGQHMADAAAELVRRGNRVIVLTSDRGYDDPSVKYPRHEVLDGVEVRRVPLTSFGKSSIAMRLLGGFSFTLQAIVRSLPVRPLDAILVSTAPPMASVAAVAIAAVRRVPIKYWVMDLNPDQLVALGVVGARSLVARVFDRLNRMVLRRAADVVVLDRFMAERVKAKLDVSAKLSIIPPWPHEDHLDPVAHGENPFRRQHGLDGKLVVMYSGNHGPSNPITTVLRAAQRLGDLPDLTFLFIGGGIGKREVDDAVGPTIRSLPYQPLDQLRYSLSAADVHLVTVGDAIVGIVHPSKVYGALAVARPVLLLGPEESHVGELIREQGIGWRVSHGDVDGAERTLRLIARTPAAELAAMGARARALVAGRLSKAELCGRFCDVVERGVTGSGGSA
ncbi:MAG TPA: glycosyltransferase family 4 protein [Gemmatimonadales bacterium]|nr:glycosyltransferase family 4 protein [Gemmatimonadales bacterium]